MGGWGGFSPPVFGQTVNPISTRGADYAHHSNPSPRIFRPCDGPAYTIYVLWSIVLTFLLLLWHKHFCFYLHVLPSWLWMGPKDPWFCPCKFQSRTLWCGTQGFPPYCDYRLFFMRLISSFLQLNQNGTILAIFQNFQKLPNWINRIISKSARAISKILFILGLYNFLAYLECVRSWSKGHSDPDLSSMHGIYFNWFPQNFLLELSINWAEVTFDLYLWKIAKNSGKNNEKHLLELSINWAEVTFELYLWKIAKIMKSICELCCQSFPFWYWVNMEN